MRFILDGSGINICNGAAPQLLLTATPQLRHTLVVPKKPTQSIRLSDKSAKLTVRCSDELRRVVAKEAIDRGTTIEELCVEFIAAGLGVELLRETNVA
jgi:hypothetical protein